MVGTVLPPCGKTDYCKITSVRMCDLSVQSMHGYKNRVVHVQYARTVLMTQFVSRTLYAVPRVRVKSEVYFGLHTTQTSTCHHGLQFPCSISLITFTPAANYTHYKNQSQTTIHRRVLSEFITLLAIATLRSHSMFPESSLSCLLPV